MEDIGKRLKQIRKEKGFSLRGLGKAAHISHSFIADIESGRSKPSLDTLDALAKTLNVSILELTGNNEQSVTPKDADYICAKEHSTIEDWHLLTEGTDPELAALCNELLCRKDLQAMLKQIRNYNPETVQKLLDVIDLIEQEGQH